MAKGVAVAGCGYWGKNLVRAFHELGALRLVCDVDSRKLDELASAFSVPTTQEFEHVLQSRDIDAVVIAAPAAEHHRLAAKHYMPAKTCSSRSPWRCAKQMVWISSRLQGGWGGF